MNSNSLNVKIKITMNINDLLKTKIKKGKLWLFYIKFHELNGSISISAYNSLDIDNRIFANRQRLTIPNLSTEYKFWFHKNDKADFYQIPSNREVFSFDIIDNYLDVPFLRGTDFSHDTSNDPITVLCNQKDIRRKLYLVPFLLRISNKKASLYFYRHWLMRLESMKS